jgi:Sec-independent protein translocase protein TatA
MGQGAKAGATGGGVAGFGYGEGQNSLMTAALGAGGGAALGGALPLAGEVIGNRVNGLMRLTGKDPQLPRRIVNDAIVADGNTPQSVGAMMDDAGTRGSPMMLADTGENARGLLASVGRQPGRSKRLVRDAVHGRQNAQAERIASAVVRDLGPTANIREMGDELIERAREAAGPLYEKFYSSPGASSVKLDDLALRPSFRKALMKAANLATEEGDNATALGFQFDEAGDVILTEVPSFKTLDLIKRGMDDVVEGYRDSTTGKLNLNTGEARATNATLRALIARIDKVAPYAEARAAYAGPAKMREALEKGAKAFNKSPDDIVAIMKNMGDAEKESFRLGIRKAITDLLASRKDGGDKVALLLGTPKVRSVLARIFEGQGRFKRFVQTLKDEEAMGHTYKAVAGNSQTAERQAVDATTNDTGLAETAMDAALRGGKDGMWSAGVAAIQKLRDVGRFGAGEAGERTRESVAALLSETDPAVLRELIAAAGQAMQAQTARVGRQSQRAVRTGRNVGDFTGMFAGRASVPTEPK